VDTGGSADFIHTLNQQIHKEDDTMLTDENGDLKGLPKLPPVTLPFMKSAGPGGAEHQEKRKSLSSRGGRCYEEMASPPQTAEQNAVVPTTAPAHARIQHVRMADGN